MDRRTFIGALVIPFASLPKEIFSSSVAGVGGPFNFSILFPDGTRFTFAGMLCDKDPIDLLSSTSPLNVRIRPVGPTEITADPIPIVRNTSPYDDPQLFIDDVSIADIRDIEPPSIEELAGFGLHRREPVTFKMNFIKGEPDSFGDE
jgi:hypothetical protein